MMGNTQNTGSVPFQSVVVTTQSHSKKKPPRAPPAVHPQSKSGGSCREEDGDGEKTGSKKLIALEILRSMDGKWRLRDVTAELCKYAHDNMDIFDGGLAIRRDDVLSYALATRNFQALSAMGALPPTVDFETYSSTLMNSRVYLALEPFVLSRDPSITAAYLEKIFHITCTIMHGDE